MPFVKSGAIDLYYELHGPKPADAPAIVFAHGAGGNHLSWWQQAPHFRDRYTCLVFDHRGFGRSRDSEGGPGGDAFVDDLRTVLDHAGIERATLVAQSMGGWTCLGFALRYPARVERLLMCATHGGLRSDDIDAIWSLRRAGVADLPAGVHPAAGPRMHREQPSLHFLYEEIAALNQMTPQQLGATMRAAGTIAVEALATLTIPVRFIAGEEDIVIPPAVLDAAAKHIAGASVIRVPEAGHSVYFERPAAFNALLEDFLRT